MNMYISQQISNMTMMVKTFRQSCEFAAKKDDGNISFSEEKILKQVNKATERFLKDLSEIKD